VSEIETDVARQQYNAIAGPDNRMVAVRAANGGGKIASCLNQAARRIFNKRK
jgi:hypothetical protein